MAGVFARLVLVPLLFWKYLPQPSSVVRSPRGLSPRVMSCASTALSAPAEFVLDGVQSPLDWIVVRGLGLSGDDLGPWPGNPPAVRGVFSSAALPEKMASESTDVDASGAALLAMG
jgi:hypothetical protein